MTIKRKPPAEPCYECDPAKGFYWACEGCKTLWQTEDRDEVPRKKRSSLKRSRVNPISARRRKESTAYHKERGPFLITHLWCEVGPTLTGEEGWECDKAATQVHHVVNRSQGRSLVTDVRNFCAVCASCHEGITVNPAWAKENGWTYSHIEIPNYELCEVSIDDLTLVRLESTEPLALMSGSRVWPELWVLAYAVGVVTHEDSVTSVASRNGRMDDSRLANIRRVAA